MKCHVPASWKMPGESYVLPDESANIKQPPDIIAFSENQRQMFELTVSVEGNVPDAATRKQEAAEKPFYKI